MIAFIPKLNSLNIVYRLALLAIIIFCLYGCNSNPESSISGETNPSVDATGSKNSTHTQDLSESQSIHSEAAEPTPTPVNLVLNGEIRGVWVQAESFNNAEKIDEMLKRAEAGGFNAVFVDIFLHGQAMYDSELVDKYGIVDEDFNPLRYLVSEARQKGIQVHGWFVAGAVGFSENSPLIENPDWALVGSDGRTTGWLNYVRPDVRQFTNDLMYEVIEGYEVDGIHFDYTRYPGPEWGFDPYSIELFQEIYGIDLNILKYRDLPAYGKFEGNPLIFPGSAQILAEFSNGYPAVALNKFGEGEAVLLNWDANKRRLAIGSEIVLRSIQRMLRASGQVYLLRSETNAEEYGYGDFERGQNWLKDMGWDPVEIIEAEINDLEPGSVLVLPNVYLISAATGQQLASFVENGGGVIFIDGPTRSITNSYVRAVTGMNFRGRYFNSELLMTANGDHNLIPTSGRSNDIKTYQDWDENWKEFRKQGINMLIQEVYDRVKKDYPQVVVSVTVTSKLDRAANDIFQDWTTWLEGGYIDLLIPRFYVEKVKELSGLIRDWKPYLGDDYRINVGVMTHFDKDKIPKNPDQLLAEIELVKEAGSNGIMLFDLDNMSDEQLQMLGELSSSERQP